MSGPTDLPSSGTVIIGQIVKPRGLHGEVVVRSLSDVPGRFEELEGAFVVAPDGKRSWLRVESVRRFREMFLVKFESISDRLAARDRLAGCQLEIPRQLSPPAGDGEYYYYELIGLAVFTDDGDELGRLESIIETGANDVYVVRTAEGGEVLIPATHEVVETVDVPGGRMVIHPIPGLIDGRG